MAPLFDISTVIGIGTFQALLRTSTEMVSMTCGEKAAGLGCSFHLVLSWKATLNQWRRPPNPRLIHSRTSFEEPDLHWLSDDQIREMHEKLQEGSVKIPPPLKDWVEIDPKATTYQVTFGKARRVLWGQFKQEHALFMNNVQKLKSGSSTDTQSLQNFESL
jgi:hypothetical protein